MLRVESGQVEAVTEINVCRFVITCEKLIKIEVWWKLSQDNQTIPSKINNISNIKLNQFQLLISIIQMQCSTKDSFFHACYANQLDNQIITKEFILFTAF